MKLKEIGIAVLETTSAGSIASVASSLFTPTSDGRPAVIRRTRKKKDKDPSIYEGSAKPEYHNTQVKGKDPIPSKSKPTSGHQSSHPFRGKLVGEGDMEADREAGIKWVNNPEWEQLHNMDLDMIKDFLEHKEGVSEAVGDSAEALYKLQDELGLEDNILVDELARYLDVDQIADFVAHFRRHHEMNYSNNDEGISEQPDQMVAKNAAQLRAFGGGKASAGMVAKGLDKMSAGGTIPPNLVKAIAPYAQAIQKMMSDPKLFARFKMLMKQANAGTAGTAVGRKMGEKAPPGREKQIKALKGKVDNPYAVSWASYNKSKGKK
jgi:hypothetical protein